MATRESSILRVGNGAGFWGDDPHAPARLAAWGGLDVVTLDYLAEMTVSVLARLRDQNPQAGYAGDIVEVAASLAGHWQAGRPLTVITNAGGLNVSAAASAVSRRLRELGLRGLPVGQVWGDDLMPDMARLIATGQTLAHLETGAAIHTVADRLVCAHAYLGAAPAAEALRGGARIVITGRLADPSLTVAAAMAHFGWPADAWPQIANATVAGHLIECGAQATGGIATDYLSLDDPADMGYPVVEIAADGGAVLTKPPGTGGAVTLPIVKEQLLYELGDPARYLSPDAIVDFTTVGVRQQAPDRVEVTGATGHPPTNSYKVSAAYRDGYTASGTLVIPGPQALAKAQRAAEVVATRLGRLGHTPRTFHAEYLGTGACAPGVMPPPPDLPEVVLRLTVADPDRRTVETFAGQLIPLVTTGPAGTTGYFAGRPAVREVFAYWPCLIDRAAVQPQVSVQTL